MTDRAITAATEAYNAALAVLASRPWRQGMSEPRNLYAIVGDAPDRVNDLPVGRMDTPELAEEACTAHNARLARAAKLDPMPR